MDSHPEKRTLAWQPSRVGLLLFVGAALIFLWHASLYRPWVEDDAYISFRYAQNLVQGHGPVFNPGEKVEGYSNPAWVALTAVALKLGLDPLKAAQGTGMLAGLLTLLLAWRLSAAWLGRASWAAAMTPLILAATPLLPRHSVTGLETSAFAMGLLAAVWGFGAAEGRGARIVGVLGLVMLVFLRPEGALYALVVAAWRLLAHGRRDDAGRLAVGVALGSILVLVAARLAVFGALMPNTYHAKVTGAGRGLMDGLIYSVDFLRESGGGVLLGLFLAALLLADRRRLWLLATACVGLMAAVVLAAGGDWMHHYRFFVPVYPLLVAGAAVGGGSLHALVREKTRRSQLAALILMLVVVASWLNIYKVERTVWRTVMPWVLEEQYLTHAYTRAGQWLADNAQADAKVAISDIGMVGYVSGLPIVDMFGLIDPHIARAEGRQHFKNDPEHVLSQEPDFVVLVSGPAGGHLRVPDAAMAAHQEFRARYRLLKSFAVGFRGETVEVFRRL